FDPKLYSCVKLISTVIKPKTKKVKNKTPIPQSVFDKLFRRQRYDITFEEKVLKSIIYSKISICFGRVKRDGEMIDDITENVVS
ncbi:MAG: hypothetical protein ACE5H1_08775, partial [Thermodesulfobacteriota bacterium]